MRTALILALLLLCGKIQAQLLVDEQFDGGPDIPPGWSLALNGNAVDWDGTVSGGLLTVTEVTPVPSPASDVNIGYAIAALYYEFPVPLDGDFTTTAGLSWIASGPSDVGDIGIRMFTADALIGPEFNNGLGYVAQVDGNPSAYPVMYGWAVGNTSHTFGGTTPTGSGELVYSRQGGIVTATWNGVEHEFPIPATEPVVSVGILVRDYALCCTFGSVSVDYVTVVGPENPYNDFVRGDANGDGDVNTADAVSVLGFLFLDGDSTCLDALDYNDSGGVTISDAFDILCWLFCDPSGLPPGAPYPDCGPDGVDGDLTCVEQLSCP